MEKHTDLPREIGGYMELERFGGSLLHDGALALNSGRACLAYLIEQRQIRKIVLPSFLCDAVRRVCLDRGVEIRSYAVGYDFLPRNISCGEDEWLYVVNYYGQLTQEVLHSLSENFPRLIVDNAQAYFAPAVEGVDTIYTCRKFFGVADGAFLYTDADPAELQRDESFDRMDFVLGRFERPAGEFYAQAAGNNDRPSFDTPRYMSALTENLLRAIDYDSVKARRTENFALLHSRLGAMNQLALRPIAGAFAYPLMLDAAPALRKGLIERKIFVPTLWPNVLKEQQPGTTKYRLANNILPLPCDQRYGPEDMELIIQAVLDLNAG